MPGPGCGAKVEVLVQRGYSAKYIQMPCGSTGVDGGPNLCEQCERRNAGRDWRREAAMNGEQYDDDY